jgi:hypothetical protein
MRANCKKIGNYFLKFFLSSIKLNQHSCDLGRVVLSGTTQVCFHPNGSGDAYNGKKSLKTGAHVHSRPPTS